ncbi:MAG: VPLPA-CTERM sorting domain-containing protein, partial [Thermoguttaceae bacterium]
IMNTLYGNQLEEGIIRMISFDVTDLLQLKYGNSNIQSAYLFAWEDQAFGDFDYNDTVYIITNLTPNVPSATPEPASAIILASGLIGIPFMRRFRRFGGC